MKRTIAIIGGGFSGAFTAIHLSRLIPNVSIILFEPSHSIAKGTAYSSYSKKHLLNVIGSKMSAFDDNPFHFIQWLKQHPLYNTTDTAILNNAFLPRYIYGEYLEQCWHTETAKNQNIQVLPFKIKQLARTNNGFALTTQNNDIFNANMVIVATGNHLPQNPQLADQTFTKSHYYFQNPWSIKSVQNLDHSLPVFILGNGLTMVDTVIGLLEQGFNNKIYAISPNGLNLLPHRHPGLNYEAMINELDVNAGLLDWVKLFRKHVRIVRSFGISAEPIIDSLRSITPTLWQNLSVNEKKYFMRKLRHLWGVARHRVPLHIHDALQKMRLDKKLNVEAGKLISLENSNNGIHVSYVNKKTNTLKNIFVGRVINCTGPESNFSKIDSDSFLYNAINSGLISQDELKLGVNANPETFEIIDANGNTVPHLYTIGSNLRGLFWESTAIGELRKQTILLATHIYETKK